MRVYLVIVSSGIVFLCAVEGSHILTFPLDISWTSDRSEFGTPAFERARRDVANAYTSFGLTPNFRLWGHWRIQAGVLGRWNVKITRILPKRHCFLRPIVWKSYFVFGLRWGKEYWKPNISALLMSLGHWFDQGSSIKPKYLVFNILYLSVARKRNNFSIKLLGFYDARR